MKSRIKKIPLTQGEFVLVDLEDYGELSKRSWTYKKNKGANTGYARSRFTLGGKRRWLFMHRIILKVTIEQRIDHKNGNGLDNRKKNLRLSTAAQNTWNKPRSKFKKHGKFKGTVKMQKGKNWGATIIANGKRYWLGTFPTERLAAEAYKKAAKKYHGEFARWK